MGMRFIIRAVISACLLVASIAVTQSKPQSASTQSPAPPPATVSPYLDESVKLNQMAVELQQQVAKSTKDQLSIDVIRRAEAIEHTARSLKERMKGQ
jgi:outer membrane murein-binding lipoprotein Lpp